MTPLNMPIPLTKNLRLSILQTKTPSQQAPQMAWTVASRLAVARGYTASFAQPRVRLVPVSG